MRAFLMKIDSPLEPKATAGTVVYPIRGDDYGLARDDERATGIPHRSVTLDRAGGYPSFTVAEANLESIDAPDFDELTDNHVSEVCKPGSVGCCRYLVMGPAWECAKVTSMRLTIDLKADRGEMRATGDNCDGRAARAALSRAGVTS